MYLGETHDSKETQTSNKIKTGKTKTSSLHQNMNNTKYSPKWFKNKAKHLVLVIPT